MLNQSFYILIVLAFFNLNAQEKGDFYIGAGGGLNLATLTTEDIVKDNNEDLFLGFNLRIHGEYVLSKNFGLKGELIYETKGEEETRFNGINEDIRANNHYKLEYITLPVSVSWYFSDKHWYLNLGPYLGFLLNAENTRLDIDANGFFKNTDFGLNAGIGKTFSVSEKMSIYSELETQVGLTDVTVVESYNRTNVRVSLSLGINLGI